MTKNITKVTASSLAAIAASSMTTGAVAEEAKTESVGNPLTVTVVGGLVMSDFSEDGLSEGLGYGAEKLGDPGTDVGGFGAISMGRAFDEGSAFDWRVSGSVTEFIANERSAAAGYYIVGYGSEARDDADWQHFDMEIGRTQGNENSNIRIAAGLRLTHLDRSSSASYDANQLYYSQELEAFTEGEFFGGGPRASIEGRIGGTVGLEFAGSVAGVFGKETVAIGEELTYGVLNYELAPIGGEASGDDWKWLMTAEVSAGLSLKPSESVSISAGYRYEQISRLDDNIAEDTVHSSGPYMKMEVKF